MYHLKEIEDIMIYYPLIFQDDYLEKKDQITKVFCCPSDMKAKHLLMHLSKYSK